MHNLLNNFLLQTKDCDIELTLPLSRTPRGPPNMGNSPGRIELHNLSKHWQPSQNFS